MGGKSTLLRQTCLAALLAHVGAWVPAEALRLSPVDALFVRMGGVQDLWYWPDDGSAHNTYGGMHFTDAFSTTSMEVCLQFDVDTAAITSACCDSEGQHLRRAVDLPAGAFRDGRPAEQRHPPLPGAIELIKASWQEARCTA